MPIKPNALRSPALLIILDGFGLNPSGKNNAVVEADTPNFDRYFSSNPMTQLEASGSGVGLPEGQMGNSEVGHMTIGSGTIVKQDLVRIGDAIEDKSFFDNPALLSAVEAAKVAGRPLHLLGLVSDGGVHSHIDHLKAMITLCSQHDVVPQVHMITDGRDTAPRAAQSYLSTLEAHLKRHGGYIGSICGRYYAMDRDNRWQRTQLAWDALVRSRGKQSASATQAIEESYGDGISDEFIKPVLMPRNTVLEGGDELVFFNFRNARTKQISAALVFEHFEHFDRGPGFHPVNLTCMTYYDGKLEAPIAYAPIRPEITLGSLVSQSGYKQLHCAETEKYPHVTFFFNGGREHCFVGEDRSLIDSPNVATYDLQPEMSAAQVADTMVEALRSHQYEFLIVNFANGDMVGHTAVRDAVIKAVEVLDKEVGRVLDVAVESGYSVVLTADHGNCDEMVDPETGEPHTQHTLYPVPCMVIDKDTRTLAEGNNLSAIAPTLLQLMGIKKPDAMSGNSLILDDWERIF
jgi:2,3-bisphosphoglycerate-independent phosphoglycerate mutase